MPNPGPLIAYVLFCVVVPVALAALYIFLS
jgi:hypothetical protein